MPSQALIWQSSFLKFILSQQQLRSFRQEASSKLLCNLAAILIVILERHFQLGIQLCPLLGNYSHYYSTVCLFAISLFAYNIVDLTVRYLHCCYRLGAKFAVQTEQEKADLSQSFHLIPGASSAGVVALNTSLSPHQRTPHSLLGNSPSQGRQLPIQASHLGCLTPQQQQQQQQQSLLFQSIYLPSASPKSPSRSLHHHHQHPQAGGTPLPSPRQSSPPSNSSINQSYHLAPSSIRYPGTGGSGCSSASMHASQNSPASPMSAEFAHLSRLRYQQGVAGTPRQSRLREQQQQQQQASGVTGSISSSPGLHMQNLQNHQHHQLSQSPQLQFGGHSITTPVGHADSIRLLLGVEPACLDRWLRGIRAWLHGTIIEPLSRDVERANARLRSCGAGQLGDHPTIGVSSLQQLHAASAAGAGVQQAVSQLMPYLALCEDQGYLVRRLAELASVPCLGAYRWDSSALGTPLSAAGAASAFTTGSVKLPDHRNPSISDANLVMRLLAAYLDRCLPPLPGDAKPFSSIFYLEAAGTSSTSSTTTAASGGAGASSASVGICSSSSGSLTSQHGSSELRIYQASKQPAHFQLLYSTSSNLQSQGQQKRQTVVLDLSPGPRNLFYCLLAFFCYRWSRCNSKLGQLSLGESGLNLAWIFEGHGLNIEELLVNTAAAATITTAASSA